MRTTYELKLDRVAPPRRPAQAQSQGGAGRVLAVAAVAAATATALWWWWPTGPVPAPAAVATPTAPSSASAQWWNAPNAAGGASPATAGNASPAALAPPGGRTFELDASGQLQLDARTLVKLEQLVALTAPHELPEVLAGQLQGMPPAAAAAARDLVQRYEGYAQAQKSASLADAGAESPEAALAELDQLRSLRQAHFGAATAERLFGDDQRIARRLLEFMRDDATPGATMDEKAVRAQARYDADRQADRAAVAR
jgi:hypothetical protein